MYYLGVVDQINMTNSKKRDTEPQLVDIIEENQVLVNFLNDLVGLADAGRSKKIILIFVYIYIYFNRFVKI